jgi:SAM-dependent methyltransferase
MTTGFAGFLGHAPKVDVAPDADLQRRLAERAKYEKMWAFQQYREVAPGESAATLFLSQARPKAGSEVIDFGAGTGRGALMLALLGGCKVTMLDFAENCLDEDVRNALTTQAHVLSFQLQDLNRPAKVSAQYGYCTDVMEHIPPQDVDRVLRNVLKAAQHVFFQISCTDDVCGALIGEPLHLSVHPYSWWHKKFQELDCAIHWSRDDGHTAIFYVTAWTPGTAVVDYGEINTSEAKIIENVKANLDAGWSEVTPHPTNDVEVMILGGGPSLNEFIDDIREKRAAGVKLVTLNGTYNWALEHGLTPSAQIMVDAREFNKRFTKPVVDDCKYLISSQCHPSVLEGLPHDRTLLWHTTMSAIRDTLNESRERWYGVPGGSTVMLRAIPLLRMLGFKRFHLYGFDSCVIGKDHHAYSQPENDTEVVIDTIVGGKVFKCHAWQIAQAQEFMDLVKFLGDELELEVYGDGLINHILRTGAELSEQ